jgi:hypothetical protein
MGYYVNISITGMVILEENYSDCIKVCKELVEEFRYCIPSDASCFYTSDADNLACLLDSLQFSSVEVRDNWVSFGDYWEIEKWHFEEDEEILKKLAPFIADGGGMEILGEDGDAWSYCFEHGKVYRRESERVWKEKVEI